MMTIDSTLTQWSSLLLRALAYIFLRWVPGPSAVPTIIFALFAVYVVSFIRSYRAESGYNILDGSVNVSLKQVSGAAKDSSNPSETEGLTMEDINAAEIIIAEEKPARPIRTLLIGTPSPTSPVLSLVTFLINLAIVAMTADVLLTTPYYWPSDDLSFVRIGYVAPTEVKFLIREPDQSKMPVTFEIHIKDPHPPFDNPLWQTAGGARGTTIESDYTAVVTVPLRHSHQRVYEWRTSNNHSGEFLAPPKAGRMPEYFGGKFTFLATSCIIPRFPYSPLDHPLSIPGLRHLARALPSLGAQFMLFMGDFIYIDVPRRFGSAVEDYRQKYRRVYDSPDWAPVGQNLSWIHVLDDHDIANDWSSGTTGVYKAAIDPWHHYHMAANPPPARKAGTSASRGASTYFEFTQGPASFFMLDTRTFRSSNDMDSASSDKTMLGKEQLDDFLYWLSRPEPRGVKWKIVASSVPFTKNWPVNLKDTWGGFLYERSVILPAMWDAGMRGYGVVIVSGDRHEFAATKFPPPPDSNWPDAVTVHEFSASPLNQFSSPLPSYKQTDQEDVMIKYIHRGNSKFGALTMEAIPDSYQSSLHYSLFIDGRETWNTTILSPPTQGRESKAGSIWSRIKFG